MVRPDGLQMGLMELCGANRGIVRCIWWNCAVHTWNCAVLNVELCRFNARYIKDTKREYQKKYQREISNSLSTATATADLRFATVSGREAAPTTAQPLQHPDPVLYPVHPPCMLDCPCPSYPVAWFR